MAKAPELHEILADVRGSADDQLLAGANPMCCMRLEWAQAGAAGAGARRDW